MPSDYEVVIVGGGVGGAALARPLAAAGARVLVLEQTREFKDRVRGENFTPWALRKLKRWSYWTYSVTRVLIVSLG